MKYCDVAKELCGIARELSDLAERLSKIEASTPELKISDDSELSQKPVLSVTEMGEYLGVSRQVAYTLIHRADFPVLHIGKRTLIPRNQLIKWINSQIEQDRQK